MSSATFTKRIQDAQAFGKVAVLMGGTSAEREVSLRSGTAVLNALQQQSVDAHGIDVGDEVLNELSQGGFDRAFIVLHGRGGEDGVMQGALETLGLPYTGSGVLGSSLGMDKLRCKQLWQGAGMPTPAYAMAQVDSDFDAVVAELGLPLMVKPVHEGSSIGMSKVERAEDLPAAVQLATKNDAAVLLEQWVSGAEYTVAVVNDQALPAIRLETPNEFYDFAAKYQANNTQYHCPCGLDEAKEHALQALALAAFRAVGASGWGRVDFMADQQGRFYLLEVNTVPGMTDHSLVPMAAKVAGISFEQLVWMILETSMHGGGR